MVIYGEIMMIMISLYLLENDKIITVCWKMILKNRAGSISKESALFGNFAFAAIGRLNIAEQCGFSWYEKNGNWNILADKSDATIGAHVGLTLCNCQ